MKIIDILKFNFKKIKPKPTANDLLIQRAKLIKLSLVADKCFKDTWFNVCPLYGTPAEKSKHMKVLHSFHCIDFKHISDDDKANLRMLVTSAVITAINGCSL